MRAGSGVTSIPSSSNLFVLPLMFGLVVSISTCCEEHFNVEIEIATYNP